MCLISSKARPPCIPQKALEKKQKKQQGMAVDEQQEQRKYDHANVFAC